MKIREMTSVKMRAFIKNVYFSMLRILPKRRRIEINFLRRHKYWPDLENPRSFSELLCARTLQAGRADFTRWADKIEAKQLAAEILGKEYIIPTLWSGPQIDRATFDKLSAPFVLKANNASGANAFVWSRSEQVYDSIIPQLLRDQELFLRTTEEDFYREIPGQFIVEPLLTDEQGKVPRDFKFHVFGGEVLAIQVDIDRFEDHRRNFYDAKWQRIELTILYQGSSEDVQRPDSLEEMIYMARCVGAYFDYVRVDFYELSGRPLFGEVTFVHEGGYGVVTPRSVDHVWGEAWRAAIVGRARDF